MLAYARDLQPRFPYDPDAPRGIPHVIRSGATEFYPTIDSELIDRLDAPDETAKKHMLSSCFTGKRSGQSASLHSRAFQSL